MATSVPRSAMKNSSTAAALQAPMRSSRAGAPGRSASRQRAAAREERRDDERAAPHAEHHEDALGSVGHAHEHAGEADHEEGYGDQEVAAARGAPRRRSARRHRAVLDRRVASHGGIPWPATPEGRGARRRPPRRPSWRSAPRRRR